MRTISRGRSAWARSGSSTCWSGALHGRDAALPGLGSTDTAVTMAAKSHLRNGRPVVVAFSTNDALSGSAENIAALNRKNYYLCAPSARTT